MSGCAAGIQTVRCYVEPDGIVEQVICRACDENLGPLESDPERQYEQVTPTGSCWPCAMGEPVYTAEDWDPSHEAFGPLIADPCPECGAVGACGWDSEGRALIHATEIDS